MPKVSMTVFNDFLVKSGAPKQTVVSKAKNGGPYHPAHDFWKELREAIVKMHTNGLTASELTKVERRQHLKPRVSAYPGAIAGYKKWLGRKSAVWFSPKRTTWDSGGLEVVINPELGLEWSTRKGTSRHLIKLYFKKAVPTKLVVDASLTLMQESLRPKAGTEVSFLDVPRSSLRSFSGVKKDLMPLVYAEAAGFATLWDHL